MSEAVTRVINEAKTVVATLLSDPMPPVNIEKVFGEDSLRALATLERLDPSTYAIIRHRLKLAKISLRDLDHSLKPHRAPLRIVPDEEAEQPGTAGSYLDDAPLPDLIIPAPYLLSAESTLIMHQSPDPEQPPYEQSIAYAPILITGRLQSIDTHGQWLRLAWKRSDRWQHMDIDRGVAMNAQKLIELAGQGFPVATDNVANVARYLHELEAANYQNLPTARMATRLGWQGEQGAYGFLSGRTLIRLDETIVIDDLSSVPGTQWQENWIVFHGDDDGDEQLTYGFHVNGTLDGWKKAIEPIVSYPKVMLGFYASCAAPLLELLHVPNFGIDWNGRTSRGKTTTARVAGSVWGNPDERQAGESVIFSWHQTRVWPERAAAVLTGLPIILDESQLAPKDVPKILYMLTNGIGKGRGSRRGLAASKRWRTVLLSTGEAPITSMSEDGGAKMRCFSIRGNPFGTHDEQTHALVNELNAGLQLNYGHVGPLFAQWLQRHLDELDEWKSTYIGMKQAFIKQVNDEAAFRLSDYAALIELTALLVYRALDKPWTHQCAIPKALWQDIVHEASGAAGDRRALAHVLSWAASHQEAFEGRHVREKDNSPRAPVGGWAGKWPHGEGQRMCWLPNVLTRVLAEGAFNPEGIKELWRENGWLILESGRKTYENRETFFTERQRMVVLDLVKAEREDDAPVDGTNGTGMGQ